MKSGHLKEFVVAPEGSTTVQTSRNRRNMLPPPLGIIKVTHVASIGTNLSRWKRILSMVSVEDVNDNDRPGKRPKLSRE